MKIKTGVQVVVDKFYRIFHRKLKVMTAEETIDYIVKNRCSIARYGDGEVSLIRKYGIGFQDYDKNLSKELKNIKTTDKLLVCVPFYLNKNVQWEKYTERDQKYWKRERFLFEGWYRKYFDKNILLGDTQLSRFYLPQKDKSKVSNYVKKLKTIWDKRTILFVEGYNSRLGYGNDLFDNASSIRRIVCPPQNAYDKYEEILETVKRNAKKDDLIIIALGPTATVLAKDLSECNLQALDLGHIDVEYEWFRMGATKKEPIPNKHVNECGALGECDISQLDKEYLGQIIERI